MPAGRKYRRKPRTKRGRRKPKKSIHHKKRKYAKKKLSSLLYQMKLQAKLNKMSIGNIFYGAKNINEMEQNEGNIKLRDTYSNNELPLLMLSLRSIRNGGNSPSAIMKLQQNGHDFTTVNSVDAMGTSGAISDKQPNSGADYRNLLHRYSQVKLLLWQLGNHFFLYLFYAFLAFFLSYLLIYLFLSLLLILRIYLNVIYLSYFTSDIEALLHCRIEKILSYGRTNHVKDTRSIQTCSNFSKIR